MENRCICTTGGATTLAVGTAASLLCTALVMATDPACGPGAGDCFTANGSPGCEDTTCCRTICACDPFCCSTTWDAYCSGPGYVPGCGAYYLCSLPAAACCLPDASCQTLNPDDCELAGGLYMGSSSDCGSVVCGLPPANDNCENAIVLECGTTVMVDNTFATKQAVEDSAPVSCRFGTPAPLAGSVWYIVEGTGDTVQIDTCATTGTADDTLIVVYSEGSPIADCSVIGLEVACNDDADCGPIGLNSRVCISTDIGVNYLVGIGSFSDSDRGVITVTATCPCPAGACCFSTDGHCEETNETACGEMGGTYQGDGVLCADVTCPIFPDTCAGAMAVDCGSSTTFDQTLGTSDPSDPIFSCHFGGAAAGFNSAWFTFVADDTSAVLSTCASPTTLDTLIGVYDGSCGSLVEIACGEDACGATGFLSEVCASGLTIGNTYYVQVAAFSVADAGMTTLDITCPCASGACCLPNGSCAIQNQAECTTNGGSYLGDGTTCDGVTCPNCLDTACPPGGILEGEANCGVPTDTVNGGCNSSPVVLTQVNCGDVVCGSTTNDGATRDTDWYEITVTEETRITVSVVGTSVMDFGFISDANGAPVGDCGTAAQIAPVVAASCGVVSKCVDPGTYWIFIGSDFAAGTAACPSNYVATFSCVAEDCPEACGPGSGDCFSSNGSVGCEDIACCDAVCALDTFCCATTWDDLCAQTANCICEGGSGGIPLNDECDGAPLVTIGGASVLADTTCATLDQPPAFTCVTSITAPGVWYQVIGDGTTLSATTCNAGTNYDTKLNVFCGSCDGLVCVTGNDDATCALNGLFSTVTWCSGLGNTYYILVQGFGGAVGTAELSVTSDGLKCAEAVDCTPAEPLANDDCADRIELLDGVTMFDTTLATTDGVGDGLCLFFGNNQIFNDIWYNYTASCDGVLTLSLCGSSYDTKIAVYEGTDCLPGAAIGCNDDSDNPVPQAGNGSTCDGSLQSFLQVNVVCGQTYKVRIGGFNAAAAGPGQIEVSCAGTPCGPNCPPDTVTSATFMPPADGIVDGADLAVLLGDWSPSPCGASCPTDTVTSATFMPPPDGVVDGADLAVLLGAWGNPGCPNGFP